MDRPKGIPTVYNGIQFRSRLEARWAAFFDLIRWPYEYEPFDLNGWIPDFLIKGARPFLVEIKPVIDFPDGLIEEIAAAGTVLEVLVLGCSVPVRSTYGEPSYDPIGWLICNPGKGAASLTDAQLIEYDTLIVPRPRQFYGLCGLIGPGHDRISGIPYNPGRPPDVTGACWNWANNDQWSLHWTRAGNLTQWKGKQSVTT